MYKHVKYLFIYHNLNFNVTFLKPFYTLSVKNNFDLSLWLLERRFFHLPLPPPLPSPKC